MQSLNQLKSLFPSPNLCNLYPIPCPTMTTKTPPDVFCIVPSSRFENAGPNYQKANASCSFLLSHSSTFSTNPFLKVARRVHTSIRVGIASRSSSVSLRTIRILLQHLIVGSSEVVLSSLLALFLAPKSPCNESESTEQDRSSDTSYYTSDSFLAGAGKSTAG